MWPQYGAEGSKPPLEEHFAGVFVARPEPAEIADLMRCTGPILAAEALTIPGCEDYIDPLGAPPLGAMARLRSPSLFTR